MAFNSAHYPFQRIPGRLPLVKFENGTGIQSAICKAGVLLGILVSPLLVDDVCQLGEQRALLDGVLKIGGGKEFDGVGRWIAERFERKR